MHVKLNGWHRLGIVLSALWAIWPFLYEGISETNLPEAFRNPDCYLIAFGPILLAWPLAYFAVCTFKWTKRGFQSPAKVQAVLEVYTVSEANESAPRQMESAAHNNPPGSKKAVTGKPLIGPTIFFTIVLVIMLPLWGWTISRYTLGFILPVNGGAVGVDLVSGLIWLFFIYTGRNLYRSLRGRRGEIRTSAQPPPKATGILADDLSLSFRSLKIRWVVCVVSAILFSIFRLADGGDGGLMLVFAWVFALTGFVYSISCLIRQMKILRNLKGRGVQANYWYVLMLVGLVFLFYGIAVEVGCFLLYGRGINRRLAHPATA